MKLSDDKMCFVCGEKNPDGLQLKFDLEGEILKTRFKPGKKYQGYTDIVHGGIIAVILDEVMVNLAWRLGIPAVTAEISVRFKQPVYVGEELEFTGWIIKDQGKLLLMEAKAQKIGGPIVATATGKCMRVSIPNH